MAASVRALRHCILPFRLEPQHLAVPSLNTAQVVDPDAWMDTGVADTPKATAGVCCIRAPPCAMSGRQEGYEVMAKWIS
jgi:hypothetical protein